MSGCLGPEVRWQEMALPEKWCGFMEHKSERNREKNMSCYINMLEKVSHTHSELRHQRQGREHDWAPYLSRNIANIQMPTTFQSKHLLRGSPPPPPTPVWTQPTRDYRALPSSPAWLARYQNETNNDEDTNKNINLDEETCSTSELIDQN